MKTLLSTIFISFLLLPASLHSQIKFDCNGLAYQAIGSPTHLYEFDFATNSYQDLGVLSDEFDLRAVGFNPIDSLAYAIDDSSKLLVQFGTDGGFGLFALTGTYVDSINNNSVVAGDFGPDGSLYVMTSGATNVIYKIDVVNKTVNELFFTNESFDKADIVWDMSDSAFYSVGSPAPSAGPQYLYKFRSGANGDTVSIEKVPTSVPAGGAFTYVGALFIDQDNRLLGHLNNDGKMYFFNKATGDATFATNTNIIGEYNDGFACYPISFPTPLPLTLISFSVESDKESYILKWQTASETNTSHFEIEYATNGADFGFIDKVAAAGFSRQRNTYSYRIPADLVFQYSRLLFRLKMVDKDGRFVYSRIAVLSREDVVSTPQLFPTITAAGNPVYLLTDRNGKATIYNIAHPGIKKEVALTPGQKVQQIGTAGLPPGLYIIRMDNVAMKFVLR